MGLKRPFDAEEMQECNAKHARQLSYSPKHLNQSDESIPYHAPLEKTGFLADDLSGLCEKKPTWSYNDHVVEKDFDTCAPFSWNPTGSCDEDARSGGTTTTTTTQSSLSQQSSGSDVTWRPMSPVEDVYTSLMNHAPTKEVPVGSNHQADVPEYVKEEILDRGALERKLMGKCIIPMPESDVCDVVGQGRKECLCLDKGSVRCVRLHVMEARERLIKAIGYERFRELGFCEMGEEVAGLWTEDEEDLFRKVVYSNPFSMGRNFWKQLMATFPSRTVKELVSYYFNVFILQRRATQNRFRTLDVDSDDDEWQVEYDEEEEEEEEEETNSNDDDEEEASPSNDAHCVYMDKDPRGGEVNVEDGSCMSFELQDSNLIFSHSSIDNRECHRCGDDDSFSFDDDCDGRLTPSDCWIKNNDLLPTSNIIKGIFGQDEWGENDDDGDNSKGK